MRLAMIVLLACSNKRGANQNKGHPGSDHRDQGFDLVCPAGIVVIGPGIYIKCDRINRELDGLIEHNKLLMGGTHFGMRCCLDPGR